MIWVIAFPGTNCELETKRALELNWLESKVFRWNDNVNTLKELDWYVIAWGFSFEDRGRSGVLASSYPIINILREASKEWKPIMWICNWAQILVESWLVTDSIWPKIALSTNKRIDHNKHLVWVWFYNTWAYLKSNEQIDTCFNNWVKIVHIPLAHAEGRFIIPEDESSEIDVVFSYCDDAWRTNESFPVNPNWSYKNAAAVSNKRWNVMAIMPHPERTENWYWVFQSLKKCLSGKEKQTCNTFSEAKKIKKIWRKKFDIEIYIKLLITDNEAVSISDVLWTDLVKYRFIGINWISEDDFNKLEKLIFEQELANFEKELFILKKWNEITQYWKAKSKKQHIDIAKWLLVKEYDDVKALEIKDILDSFTINSASSISTGIYWSTDSDSISDSYILANPISQFIEI